MTQRLPSQQPRHLVHTMLKLAVLVLAAALGALVPADALFLPLMHPHAGLSYASAYSYAPGLGLGPAMHYGASYYPGYQPSGVHVHAHAHGPLYRAAVFHKPLGFYGYPGAGSFVHGHKYALW